MSLGTTVAATVHMRNKLFWNGRIRVAFDEANRVHMRSGKVKECYNGWSHSGTNPTDGMLSIKQAVEQR